MSTSMAPKRKKPPTPPEKPGGGPLLPLRTVVILLAALVCGLIVYGFTRETTGAEESAARLAGLLAFGGAAGALKEWIG